MPNFKTRRRQSKPTQHQELSRVDRYLHALFYRPNSFFLLAHILLDESFFTDVVIFVGIQRGLGAGGSVPARMTSIVMKQTWNTRHYLLSTRAYIYKARPDVRARRASIFLKLSSLANSS